MTTKLYYRLLDHLCHQFAIYDRPPRDIVIECRDCGLVVDVLKGPSGAELVQDDWHTLGDYQRDEQRMRELDSG